MGLPRGPPRVEALRSPLPWSLTMASPLLAGAPPLALALRSLLLGYRSDGWLPGSTLLGGPGRGFIHGPAPGWFLLGGPSPGTDPEEPLGLAPRSLLLGPSSVQTADLLTRSVSLTPAPRSHGRGLAPPGVSPGSSSEGPRVSSTGLPRLNPPRRAHPRATSPGALLVASPRRNLHGLQLTKCTQWGSPEPLRGPPSVGHPPAPVPEGLPSSGSSEPLPWETLLESSRAPPPRRDARGDTSRDLLARLPGAGPRGRVRVRSSWSVPDEQR
jgi:hypothetical protein